MLKINLLSAKFDAERQHRKMLAGEACDYLTMLEDRTVRRRVHQNVRNQRKSTTKRAQKLARVMRKRRGKYMHKLSGSTCGRLIETYEKKPAEESGKDKEQRFSRCLFCGTEFTDDQDRPTLSSFAFCGETLLVAGSCKKAWLASQPDKSGKPTAAKFNYVTPEDVDHAERTRPRMSRPANLGNGRGSSPLPPNTEWVWDNEVGYRVVNRQK